MAGSTKKNIACCVGRRSSQIPWQFRDGFSFFFFFFQARRPRLCHLIFKCREETGGELLPDHPWNRQGLVKEHQLGQQDAGPVHVEGEAGGGRTGT